MSTTVRKNKLDMIHIQNFTLAGGVAIGTVAPSNIGLHGAMIIGTLAGIMAGNTGIIVACIDDRSGYLNHLTDACLSGGKQRTNNIQSAFQAAALGLTLLMAIAGGLITGLILRLPIFGKKTEDLEDLPRDEFN